VRDIQHAFVRTETPTLETPRQPDRRQHALQQRHVRLYARQCQRLQRAGYVVL
jgi:hypothetical protein